MPVPRRAPQQVFGDRVLLVHVAADDDDAIGEDHVVQRHAAVEVRDQGPERIEGHRPARGRVDVVGAEDGPHQLLELIERLVGQAGRRQPPDRLGLVSEDFRQARAQMGAGLVPGDGDEAAVAADHRPLDPVLAGDEVEAEAAAGAERLEVHPVVPFRAHSHELAFACAHGELAAGAAMGADRVGLGEVPGAGLVAVGDAHKGADRADLHAVAALVAAVEAAREAGDRGVHALLDGAERHRPDHLLAHPHAPLALDAAVHVHNDDGAELDVLRVEDPLRLAEPADPRAVGHHHVLQLALAALVADRAVERMVGEQHVEHEGAGIDHPRRVRVHDHAVGDRHRAGGVELALSLDLDQAHAARGQHRQPLLVAEGRDLDPQPLGDRQDGRPGLCFEPVSIDRDGIISQWNGHLL